MSHNPFIDYYEKNNIIPVRQNITDLSKHFARREALYTLLGIPFGLLKGKNIIEFGPGSGDNAIYTASLSPDLYVLVDGNKSSVDLVQEKVAKGYFPAEVKTEVHYANLFDYQDTRQFDVVLCEGALPGQSQPKQFLEKLASFVENKGGLLVVTTTTACSLLAEVCRRMLKPLLYDEAKSLQDNVDQFVTLFTPDLDSLVGMSRLYEDWVLDSILHPWKNTVFSIPETLKALGDDFYPYGSSPAFFTDWRWYKSIPEASQHQQVLFEHVYYQNLINFLDYRITPISCDPELAQHVERLCQKAFDVHISIWEQNDQKAVLDIFIPLIQEISQCLQDISPLTAESLDDFVTAVQNFEKTRALEMRTFHSFFGRGQQYFSVMKRA